MEFIKSNCCTVGREQWEYVAQAVRQKIHSDVVFDLNVWAVGSARCFSRWLLLEHRGEVALCDDGLQTLSWKLHSHGVWMYMLESGFGNSWKVVSGSSSATLLASFAPSPRCHSESTVAAQHVLPRDIYSFKKGKTCRALPLFSLSF